MKWHSDSEHRNFGADLLGKGDAVLYSLPSKFRAVRGYQNTLVHFLPPSPVAEFISLDVGTRPDSCAKRNQAR